MAATSGEEGFAPTSNKAGSATLLEDDPTSSRDMEVADLRRIFNHFDSDGSGSIDCDELRSAVMALGIKVTLSSSKKILAKIDTDKNGTIEWPEFHQFFEKVKNPEEIKSMLSSVNAKYIDYKQMVDGDPNFEKRFFVPPTLAWKSKFSGHADNVESVSWLDERQPQFLTCSLDGSLRLWDLSASTKASKANGSNLNANNGNIDQTSSTVISGQTGGIYAMNVINAGQSCLTALGRKEKNITLVDLTKKDTVVLAYDGPISPIYSVSAEKSHSPQFFLAGAKNGQMSYFDINRSTAVCQLNDLHDGVVYSVDFHKDCRQMCSASSDGQINILDCRAQGLWRKSMAIEDAAASEVVHKALWRGEKEIISCGEDCCIKKWDIRKIRDGPIENYLGHTSPVREIVISPDQKYCMSSTNDGCIRIWVLDERQYMEEEADTINSRIRRLEAERKVMDSDLYEGDYDLVDENKLKNCVDELVKHYKRSEFVEECWNERDTMNCVQARLGLEGHQLPVTTLAWRDAPHDPNKAQILTGCHDQVAGLFEIKKPKLRSFGRWQKESADEDN